MKYPGLWAWRGGILQGQRNAEALLVLLSDPPYNEFVVTTMP
jgi:hypothetical protein